MRAECSGSRLLENLVRVRFPESNIAFSRWILEEGIIFEVYPRETIRKSEISLGIKFSVHVENSVNAENSGNSRVMYQYAYFIILK